MLLHTGGLVTVHQVSVKISSRINARFCSPASVEKPTRKEIDNELFICSLQTEPSRQSQYFMDKIWIIENNKLCEQGPAVLIQLMACPHFQLFIFVFWVRNHDQLLGTGQKLLGGIAVLSG